MGNLEISLVFKEIALLIELFDPNPKKGIIYRKAAETLEHLSNLDVLIHENKLQNVPGIGINLAKMIEELAKTGRLAYLETLKSEVPFSLLELAKLPGLGPKRIRTLFDQLNIRSLEDLEAALSEGILGEISGFGPSLIKNLKNDLVNYKRRGCVEEYPYPYFLGEALTGSLLANGWAEKMDFSEGEFTSDLNFTALAKDPDQCLEAFMNHYFVEMILSRGENYAKILLKTGWVASLLVMPYRPPYELLEESFVSPAESF